MIASADKTICKNSAYPYALLAIVAQIGISCGSDVVLTVKDRATDQALEGVRVERHRPVSRTEKVINPVGAFYHPLRLADTKTTDARGQVAFSRADEKDVFRFHNRSSNALSVLLGGRGVHLSPGTNRVNEAGWGASVGIENGLLKQSVWSLSNSPASP